MDREELSDTAAGNAPKELPPSSPAVRLHRRDDRREVSYRVQSGAMVIGSTLQFLTVHSMRGTAAIHPGPLTPPPMSGSSTTALIRL